MGEAQMARAIPVFETQMRGLHRAQVTDYLLRIHGEIESLQEHIRMLERDASYAEADRERLNTEIGKLSGDIDRLSSPLDSVEGMSDRIARMMRVASDEARRTKAMAREEAVSLTRELHDEVEAARQDRVTAGAVLAELQASTAARREQILAGAKAEAEDLLQTAYNERARLAEEADEAERRRREMQIRLAEEDERRRRDAQRRLDQQIKSRWHQAETRIAACEEESRLKAAGLVASAERDAKLVKERSEAEVKDLLKVRADIVAALGEIQSRIETAVRRERITVVKTPAVSEGA
jgi:cell division septum initiation protein DivIVA